MGPRPAQPSVTTGDRAMSRRPRAGRAHAFRMTQILAVFWRHGLGHALVRAHLTEGAEDGLVLRPPWWSRWLPRVPPETTWAHAVKDALVELGPAFVKAGQILSVRSDLVPESLGEALHSLQSDVPPLPFAEVRPAVEAALGFPLEEAFTRFDPAPLAAASIAQVHLATLADGTDVAVKVKRPGIDAVFERDLEILLWLAARLERHLPSMRPYRPLAAVRELVVYTRRELDFRAEGSVATRLGAHFVEWPDVVIPRIHHQSHDLLVMDFVPGFPIDDAVALDAHGIDRRALVRTAVSCILEQILMLGLFHADPHPGNLHVTPDGRLALLDFGIFGELDEDTRRDAGLSLLMLAEGQFELAGRYLLRLAMLEAHADPRGYRRALAQLYRAWRGATVREYGFARLVYDIVSLGARHGVVYPPEVLLYVKAMTTLEGVTMRMAPEMNLADEARPYLQGLEERLHDRRRVARALDRAWPIWLDMAERLPFTAAAWLDRQWEDPPHLVLHQRETPRSRWPILATLAGIALLVSQVGPAWQGLSFLGLAVLALGLWGEHEAGE